MSEEGVEAKFAVPSGEEQDDKVCRERDLRGKQYSNIYKLQGHESTTAPGADTVAEDPLSGDEVSIPYPSICS